MEKDEERFESLALKIEEAFNSLQKLLERIGDLENISNNLENATKKITVKYAEAFSSKRLDQLREQNSKTLDLVIRDIKRIDEGILSIDAMRQQTQETISSFSKRMSTFEESMTQMRNAIQETDAKLLKILGEAGTQYANAEERVQSVEKLIDIHSTGEKFDQLSKATSDNNQILKEIFSKLSKIENMILNGGGVNLSTTLGKERTNFGEIPSKNPRIKSNNQSEKDTGQK